MARRDERAEPAAGGGSSPDIKSNGRLLATRATSFGSFMSMRYLINPQGGIQTFVCLMCVVFVITAWELPAGGEDGVTATHGLVRPTRIHNLKFLSDHQITTTAEPEMLSVEYRTPTAAP
jgi:hypothetical protein